MAKLSLAPNMPNMMANATNPVAMAPPRTPKWKCGPFRCWRAGHHDPRPCLLPPDWSGGCTIFALQQQEDWTDGESVRAMQSKLLRTAVRVQPLMPGWRTRRVRSIGSAMCSTSGSTRSNSVLNQGDHATATAADSPVWLSTSVEPMLPSTARFTQP